MARDRFSLDGRVALVTGAGRGIGRAIAMGFAEAGADLVLVSRTGADVEAAAAAARERGRRALAAPADVSDEAAVATLFDRTLAEYGRLDVLVNAAGISPIYRRAEQTSPADWDAILAVNLRGAFLCATAAGRAMLAQGGGAIVNVGSIGGSVALPRLVAYCASKGGVVQLTKVLAVEWARHNVRVNAVAPGYVETEMTAGMVANPRIYQSMCDRTPMGRLGKPEEIVGAAIFLASDAASYITGQVLYVDGGWTAA